jgi:UDP-N-acetylglucosamine--N-acetylmuramyl-(pentapeptide) pyrophosphoryl-undecaprenol N-acetylglucosamine transferase
MWGIGMKRILLSGGGTGGHIYPALAVANAVRRRYPDVEIAYIGTENGLEARIVPRSGDITFFTVKIQGFKRSLSLDNLRTIGKFVRAVKRSKEFLKEFRPEVVVGTGGYVSGPAVFAAHRLGIPTLIHEQNVVPGLTTRFLARYADVTAVSFSSSEGYLEHANRLVHTGNPRATEVIHGVAEKGRQSLGIDDSDKPIVLFVGGSRGARPINEAVMRMIPRMEELSSANFVYVTGEVHYEEIQRQLDGRAPKNLRVLPFIYNMPDVLASTSLVVGRAGASTLAELTALGIPAILIPSPYVTNNHQEANARWLEEQGAARVILERECTAENLWREITGILTDPAKLRSMGEAARSLGRPKAAEVLVDELERICNRHGQN